MNFGSKEVEKRASQLCSPATQRIYKIQLIGIRLFLISMVFVCIFILRVICDGYQSILSSAPDPDQIQIIPQGYSTSILDTTGHVTQTLVSENANRQYAALNDIPIHLQNAFIVMEDERYRTHSGVDVQGILRTLATGLSNGGSFSQGTGTITQQLLKNQVFSGGKKTSFYKKVERKLQEQYLALEVEKRYSKEQILEYYLNTINLGQNTLGVQTASKRYFNKDVSALTLSECAVLAGITQNPSAYNPITHPAKNRLRRTTVLSNMKKQGYITSEEYTDAMKDDVYKRIQQMNQQTSKSENISSYFTDALIAQVIKDLKQKCGYTETQAYNTLYTKGLTIHSTQDSQMQQTVDRITNNPKYYPKNSKYELNYQLTIKKADSSEVSYSTSDLKKWYENKRKKAFSYYYSDTKAAHKKIRQYKKAVLKKGDNIVNETISLIIQPQVSFVLIDQTSGEVKALCGGRGEKAASRTLNRATSTIRQPGSIFTVPSTYLPALDTAGMTLASVQDDTPFYYPGTKKLVKNWYGASYRGLTPLRTAISDSMNVVAVKTLNDITPKTSYDYLLNLGFTTLVDNYTSSTGKTYTDISLPLAQGGLTKGVTNLELTSAFATIANQGVYQRPCFYTKVLDHDGNVLLDNTRTKKKVSVMKDSTSWLLTSAMEDVIAKGTGGQLKFKQSNMPQAGKTGISTGRRDLWFVGYTPYLTAGIWGGYDSSRKQSSTLYHKNIWRDIMEELNKGMTPVTFPMPSSITSAKICTKCGKLAIDDLCEDAIGGSCVKQEFFARDSIPTETCDCHIRCKICKASGHLAGDGCPATQIYTAVYLQKNESAHTSDSSLVIPSYLAGSSCEVHN